MFSGDRPRWGVGLLLLVAAGGYVGCVLFDMEASNALRELGPGPRARAVMSRLWAAILATRYRPISRAPSSPLIRFLYHGEALHDGGI
jgi:hypothetical protein